VISRPGGRGYVSSFNDGNADFSVVETREAAYDDLATLTDTLRDQDALIEAFNTSATVHQGTIVRAALAAGIKHLITSEFGLDTFHPNAAQLPVSEAKLQAQRALNEELQHAVANGNPAPLAWTAIFVGSWYDWLIQTGQSWLSPATRTITRIGSGKQRVSMSRIAVNGEAVVAVLRNTENFRNRPAYFASHTITMDELIALVEEVSEDTEKPWKVIDVPDVEALKSEGDSLWNEDTKKGVENRLHTQAFLTLAAVAIFDENNKYGADFGEKLEPNWNEGHEKLKDALRLLIKETAG
jgi:hypothetical protein